MHIAFFLGQFASQKLAERVRGVRTTWSVLDSLPKTLGTSNAPRFWFHASSMGEFEQVKPIIEALKSQMPVAQIIVSFFSPSGYRNQHKYALADAVVYLPLDSRRAAKRFVAAVRPDVAVFARYDAWWNHLEELHKSGIPAVLVCATLNEASPLVKFAAGRVFMRAVYGLFKSIYTVGASETAKFERWRIISPETIITAGDTRFDRIAAQVAEAASNRVLPMNWFQEQDFVVVLGSSWQPDEAIVLPAVKRLRKENSQEYAHLRCVIVPHEPTHSTLQHLQAALPDAVLLSAIEGGSVAPEHWGSDVIVDSIGKLLRLYAEADCAYIGGGFGVCVHSVSEPAGYGVPLACAPAIGKARDAQLLRDAGALSLMQTEEDVYQWLQILISQPEECIRRGRIAHEYIYAGLGWSARISNDILKLRRLSATML